MVPTLNIAITVATNSIKMDKFEKTQERWEAFRSKIAGRLDELITETEDLFPLVFEAAEYETTTFLNAWQGFFSQSQGLIGKLMDTWHEQVEHAFLKTGVKDNDPIFVAERNKGLELEYQLEKRFRAYEISAFAKIAKRLLEEVRAILSKDFCCTQCQAPLEIKQDFFRSYYATCQYCQTVNTFEPGLKARNIEHFAINALGEEAAYAQYEAYEYAKFQNYLTDKKVFKKKALLKLYEEYLIIFLKKRIEIIPDYAAEYDKDLESKLNLQKQ